MASLRGATAAGGRFAHRACGVAGRRRARGYSRDLAGGDRSPCARPCRQAAGRARSIARHGRRSFAHDHGRAGRAATRRGTRYLSRDRHRQRPRQFHLRGARRRLVACLARRRGAGRLLRVLRPAAWRRAGARARYARRDRGERRHRRLDRAKTRVRRSPHGLRSPHLPPSRSARRPVARRAQAPRSKLHPARLCHRGRAPRGRGTAAPQARPPRRGQYRDGRRPFARRHRPAAPGFYAGLCGRALRCLAGSCHGAATNRPHDPSGFDLYRADTRRDGSCRMSCRAPCAPLHKLRQKIAGKTDPMSASDPVSPEVQARILSEALPYMQRYDEKIIVVKYGGHAMGEEQLARDLARDIVLLEQTAINPIVVHGGGPQIEAMLKKVGVQSQYAAGLRITDAKTLEIVEMVLAGSINKQMVGYINEAGGKAVGLCGKDGNMVVARKLTRTVIDPDSHIEKIIDLGFVGEPEKVDTTVLNEILGRQLIPVLAPVAAAANGGTFNVNADTFAGAIAGALHANRFLLLTDVPGVLDKSKTLIKELSVDDARRLIADGTISGGMIPKVETCIYALEKGVEGVVILDGKVPHAVLLELFTELGSGTLIHR